MEATKKLGMQHLDGEKNPTVKSQLRLLVDIPWVFGVSYIPGGCLEWDFSHQQYDFEGKVGIQRTLLYTPWKSKTKQRIVFRMIHVKDSLLPRGKVWSLDFLGT